MRPSGKLHLGNYLGAIKNWIELQNDPATTQCIFSAVDLHGITTPYDPATYQQNVKDVLLDYLAAGVDPSKSLIVRQSRVPQHAELMWLFSTITPVGWLERLPNYREKIEQVETYQIKELSPKATLFEMTEKLGELAEHMKIDAENRAKSYRNNLSLLSYPVLMAADILLYKSDLVPVGEDQLPHVELTNEIGAKFNHLFGNTFPNVKGHIATGARIMSLQDPLKKMSKTGDDGIALSDDADTIRGKIKRAVTDSESEVRFDEATKPAISNLLTIYATLSGKQISDIEQTYAGKNYGQFKTDLAEVIVNFLTPFQQRRTELVADSEGFERLLTESEEKARILASSHLQEIQAHMGIR